jgi:hypothetical protein
MAAGPAAVYAPKITGFCYVYDNGTVGRTVWRTGIEGFVQCPCILPAEKMKRDQFNDSMPG